MSYADFLRKKLLFDVPAGIDKDYSMNSALFDYQKPCVQQSESKTGDLFSGVFDVPVKA